MQVMEVNVEMRTCQVTEGLTEDAVSARLHQGGLVPPLYLHSSIHTRLDSQISESTVEAEWARRTSQLFKSQVWVLARGLIFSFCGVLVCKAVFQDLCIMRQITDLHTMRQTYIPC